LTAEKRMDECWGLKKKKYQKKSSNTGRRATPLSMKRKIR